MRRGFIFTRARVLEMRVRMKNDWNLLKLIINISHLDPFYSVLQENSSKPLISLKSKTDIGLLSFDFSYELESEGVKEQ